MTTSSIDQQVVTVNDSRFSGGDLSLSLTHQLGLIYRPLIIKEEGGEEVDAHFDVNIPPVQEQSGLAD